MTNDIEAIRHNVIEPIRRECQSFFRTLRETLAQIPEDQWLAGDGKANQPVRQTCHMLFGIENYLDGHKAHKGSRFGTAVESFVAKITPEKCPRPGDLEPWMQEVEAIAYAHLDRAVDASVRGTLRQHPPLGRMLYAMRHAFVHLSYLMWELRSRGINCRWY